MIGLLQRVTEARVDVESVTVGAIGSGLLVFVAVEPDDSQTEARRLIDRVAAYRVFADSDDRMNLSVADVGGEMLLVSQFTLAADTRKGLRPSFTTAAPPAMTVGRASRDALPSPTSAAPGQRSRMRKRLAV